MRRIKVVLVLIPLLFSFKNENLKSLVAGKITLEDLPKRWVLIVEDDHADNGFYIERWCDIGATNFKFESVKKDSCVIHFHYGGDDVTRNMFNFEASEVEVDGEKLTKGSFEYEPIDTWKSNRSVNFWWNKKKQIAQFEGLIFSKAYFVPWNQKENYDVIEDCNGCSWEKWE